MSPMPTWAEVPYEVSHLVCSHRGDRQLKRIYERGYPRYVCGICEKMPPYDVRTCSLCGKVYLAAEFISTYLCTSLTRCFDCMKSVTEQCEHPADHVFNEWAEQKLGFKGTVRAADFEYREKPSISLDDFLAGF